MDQAPNHDLLVEATGAIRQKVAEGNYYGAHEWAFVLEWQYNLLNALNADEGITQERVELVEKLSWALYDAAHGYGDRVAADLEGVEALAREVQDNNY